MILLFFGFIFIIIGFVSFSYILLKKAVKNGVLEAFEEYNNKNNCE